jgi:predicted O-methyltransferase YrrM
MNKKLLDLFMKLRATRVYVGIRNIYIAIRTLPFKLGGGTRYRQRFYQSALIKALEGFRRKSDISDHLNTIFFFTLNARPKLIVELGTRGGESTRALLSAASICDAILLSVDIKDCGLLNMPYRERWEFIKANDVEFGKQPFINWCQRRGIDAKIDVLFIDTSHIYEHTKKEIEVWSKYLSENGVMMFHDTNAGRGAYSRTDGSCGLGRNNKRGVIRAIEEFVGQKYDENSFFSDLRNNFLIKHYPYCDGLTILKKYGRE